MTNKSLCVLVVEDEALNALLIQEQLKLAGFTILGPVASVDAALSLLERQCPDVAVLDFILGTQTCERIADQLEARAVPYVLVSACHPDLLPARFERTATLLKPVNQTDMVDHLLALARAKTPRSAQRSEGS